MTGQLAGEAFASAAYWKRHFREAVRFADTIRFVHSAGGNRFLEVEPSSGLTASIEESLSDARVLTMSALLKERPEPTTLINAVAQAFVSGMNVDWRAVLGQDNFVELPTYSLDLKRFWLVSDGVRANAIGLGLGSSKHPMLGAVVKLPASGGVMLTGRLSPNMQGWLADHVVGGVVLFPGAGFVELAIRAGDAVGCSVVYDLTFQTPLILSAGNSGLGSVAMQVVVEPPQDSNESGHRSISIFSRADSGSGWVCHAKGVLRAGAPALVADLSVWPPVGAV